MNIYIWGWVTIWLLDGYSWLLDVIFDGDINLVPLP